MALALLFLRVYYINAGAILTTLGYTIIVGLCSMLPRLSQGRQLEECLQERDLLRSRACPDSRGPIHHQDRYTVEAGLDASAYH